MTTPDSTAANPTPYVEDWRTAHPDTTGASPTTWNDIERARQPLDLISAVAGTPPTEESELPHGGTIRDLRISIGKLAHKGQTVFARTLLEGRTPGTPMDDATFELNHLAHGASYHGFALVAVLKYLEDEHGEEVAHAAASIAQTMGVDGDVEEWCDDIADEIRPAEGDL